MSKKDKKVRKRKIKYYRLLLVILLLFCFSYGIYYVINIRITNIYISGNYYLSDQEIIDTGGLKNYPLSIRLFASQIEGNLKKNEYIKEVKVYKKNFNEVYINVVENTPIVYIEKSSKTLLADGKKVDKKFKIPILTNTVPSNLGATFIEKMLLIEPDILKRISEIKYDPNIDNQRFLLTMVDGNYVYVTLNTFDSINDYIDIIKNFPDKKGVLYLDSGNHFKVFDE